MSKPTYEELEHIASEMMQQDWNDLRFEKVYHRAFIDGGKWFLPKYEELERERDELAARVERLLECFNNLINESTGVAGLHLNGDIAVWSELMQGGRFEEWLLPLSESPSAALEALKAELQAEAIESILNLEHGYMQFEDGSFAYTEEAISGYATSIRQRAQGV